MPKEATMVVTRAAKTGLMPKSNPMAMPASDTWDRVSAIKEYLLKTKKMPISGAINATIIPAANPLTMKLYWKISNNMNFANGVRKFTSQIRPDI